MVIGTQGRWFCDIFVCCSIWLLSFDLTSEPLSHFSFSQHLTSLLLILILISFFFFISDIIGLSYLIFFKFYFLSFFKFYFLSFFKFYFLYLLRVCCKARIVSSMYYSNLWALSTLLPLVIPHTNFFLNPS